jgi:hypothetical protein
MPEKSSHEHQIDRVLVQETIHLLGEGRLRHTSGGDDREWHPSSTSDVVASDIGTVTDDEFDAPRQLTPALHRE